MSANAMAAEFERALDSAMTAAFDSWEAHSGNCPGLEREWQEVCSCGANADAVEKFAAVVRMYAAMSDSVTDLRVQGSR